MTPRPVSGIVAATFAIGILTGAAGAIVVRDASTPRADFGAAMADHMSAAGALMMSGDMMSGDMMSGDMMSGDMMSGSMMSPGSSFGPGMMNGPAASAMPGSQHDSHHPAASPDGAK